MSVSAFIAELISQSILEGPKKSKASTLLGLGGTWEGSFPEVERDLPQDREE
jgi:hypothetical protein